MFKIFHSYLQTQQGEFPLTPRSSCCLLPLITLFAMPEDIANGGVSTAIATTGLIFALVLILWGVHVHTKAIKDRMINQLQDNLKKLEELAQYPSSGISQREEFFREIAAKAQQPVEIVKRKVIATDSFMTYLLSDFEFEQNELFKHDIGYNLAQDILSYLDIILCFYEGLETITPYEFALLSSDFVDELEQVIISFNVSFEIEANLKLTTPKFILIIKSFFDPETRIILEHSKLVEKILKKGEKIEKLIEAKDKIDLKDYPWNELDSERLKIASDLFLSFYLKKLSKVDRNEFWLKARKNKIEYLEELGLKPNNILNKQDKTQEVWDREEQIRKNQKGIEHFKKKLSEKDERTPEERQQDKEAFKFLQKTVNKNSEEFSITTFYLQLQERLIELLAINDPTQEQKDEIEQLKQALDPILVKHIEKNLDSLKYLKNQKALFQQFLPEIRKNFQGFYVFFENGEVKDFDLDEEALMERVLDDSPERKSALIKKVM